MIGRIDELQKLNELYEKDTFQFLTMYGRRRVGKTTLLQEFAKDKKVIFFSAQEKNDSLNLNDFSYVVQSSINHIFIAPFPSWKDALDYITEASKKEKIVLIIDEFPFLAKPNPSIKSIIQHEIDHAWKNLNILLILCGSSVSFMINDVLGYESPLYGRITSSMEVLPFDYFEASKFFPNYSNNDKLLAFGILGGIPRYLNAFDPSLTISENITNNILDKNAFLYEEPMMLLRSELREPLVYNSILETIAKGNNRINTIATSIHEEQTKCNKYISTLLSIRLIKKNVPCGEPNTARNTTYELTDNYLRFWYHYLFTNKNYYEILGNSEATNTIMNSISDYMGLTFEKICEQYIYYLAKSKKLPFIPSYIGKWWGTNQYTKSQDDVDVLALDKAKESGIFVECKYTSSPVPLKEYEDLLIASNAFPHIKNKYFIFISKSGYASSLIERAKKDNVTLLTIDDLFDR